MTDIFDVAYDKVFDATCEALESRLREEPAFTIAEVEKLLESQYVADGLKWTGRNSPQEIRRSATIAAHEHVLVEARVAKAAEDKS